MKYKLIFILFIIIILAGCGQKYNVNFEPPKENAVLDDVFPLKINNFDRNIDKLKVDSNNYIAFQAYYGDDQGIIKVIQAKSDSFAVDYFERMVVPEFDNMPNHVRGKINDKWFARGTEQDGRKWYGWINNNWIFIISGKDQESFNNVVDEFKFIELKK